MISFGRSSHLFIRFTKAARGTGDPIHWKRRDAGSNGVSSLQSDCVRARDDDNVFYRARPERIRSGRQCIVDCRSEEKTGGCQGR